MSAIAHSPSFAAKAGVPQSVGIEFHAMDKGKWGAKHKATKGPKVAAKAKAAYHAGKAYRGHGGGVSGGVMGVGGSHKGESSVYRGQGGGISQGKNRPMPLHEAPEVTAWPREHRQPPHMRDAVVRDWEHTGGYRANDPDHPQLEPHHQLRDGTGFVRHVARTAYPSNVHTSCHMQGCAGGHRIGGGPAKNAHTFRGQRTRHGK